MLESKVERIQSIKLVTDNRSLEDKALQNTLKEKDKEAFKKIKDLEEAKLKTEENRKVTEAHFNKSAEDIRRRYEDEVRKLPNRAVLPDAEFKKGANVVKAQAIVSYLYRGLVVSSSNVDFASKVFPHEVKKARVAGENFRKTVTGEMEREESFDYKL